MKSFFFFQPTKLKIDKKPFLYEYSIGTPKLAHFLYLHKDPLVLYFVCPADGLTFSGLPVQSKKVSKKTLTKNKSS